MALRYRMRPCFVALNNNMSETIRSAMLPLKSAQARKIFSVTVIVPSLSTKRAELFDAMWPNAESAQVYLPSIRH
jgi:hypothetical protein